MTKRNVMLALSGTSFGAAVLPSVAMAENRATDAVASLTGDGVDTQTAIGVALLAMAVTAVIFKWAKGGLFG